MEPFHIPGPGISTVSSVRGAGLLMLTTSMAISSSWILRLMLRSGIPGLKGSLCVRGPLTKRVITGSVSFHVLDPLKSPRQKLMVVSEPWVGPASIWLWHPGKTGAL